MNRAPPAVLRPVPMAPGAREEALFEASPQSSQPAVRLGGSAVAEHEPAENEKRSFTRFRSRVKGEAGERERSGSGSGVKRFIGRKKGRDVDDGSHTPDSSATASPVPGKEPSASGAGSIRRGPSGTDGGEDTDRRSRTKLLTVVLNPSVPLEMRDIGSDFCSRAGLMLLNGVAIELRDMFRILEGLERKAEAGTLVMDDLALFYNWFEGFYGIITCIYDTEEDVLFSWLEKVGAIKMENALAPKRRKTKKERTKDLCWDILELKMQFQKKADTRVSLEDLVFEMSDEAEQLATRVLMYVQTLVEGLPELIENNFGPEERSMIESAMMGNLRASEAGKFVICAYSRGILDPVAQEAFLDTSLRAGKSNKNVGMKLYKKYTKRHVALVDKLATTPIKLC